MWPVSHDLRRVCFSFLLLHSDFGQVELGVEVVFYYGSAVAQNNWKLICYHSIPMLEQLLWAHWWCFCAAHLLLLLSTPGTTRPCLPAVDRLNSKCRASLIATPSSCLPQKQFPGKDSGLRLYSLSGFFLLPFPVSSPPDLPRCRFLETLFVDTACRRLMLLSLSSLTTLSLLFSLCAVYTLTLRCFQMEWWAAVTVAAIPSQTALLIWPYVSTCNQVRQGQRSASRGYRRIHDDIREQELRVISRHKLLGGVLLPESPCAALMMLLRCACNDDAGHQRHAVFNPLKKGKQVYWVDINFRNAFNTKSQAALWHVMMIFVMHQMLTDWSRFTTAQQSVLRQTTQKVQQSRLIQV